MGSTVRTFINLLNIFYFLAFSLGSSFFSRNVTDIDLNPHNKQTNLRNNFSLLGQDVGKNEYCNKKYNSRDAIEDDALDDLSFIKLKNIKQYKDSKAILKHNTKLFNLNREITQNIKMSNEEDKLLDNSDTYYISNNKYNFSKVLDISDLSSESKEMSDLDFLLQTPNKLSEIALLQKEFIELKSCFLDWISRDGILCDSNLNPLKESPADSAKEENLIILSDSFDISKIRCIKTDPLKSNSNSHASFLNNNMDLYEQTNKIGIALTESIPIKRFPHQGAENSTNSSHRPDKSKKISTETILIIETAYEYSTVNNIITVDYVITLNSSQSSSFVSSTSYLSYVSSMSSSSYSSSNYHYTSSTYNSVCNYTWTKYEPITSYITITNMHTVDRTFFINC